MDTGHESGSVPARHRATVERKSDREMVVTRTIHGPARLVFEAWTRAELFQQWWIPKSAPVTLVSCELDVRVGGRYRLLFDAGGSNTMAFFGTYLEVTPYSRLAWTNDEAGADKASITTVTFEERGGTTRVSLCELHPTKEALDEAIAIGMDAATIETFDQLDAFVVARAAGS